MSLIEVKISCTDIEGDTSSSCTMSVIRISSLHVIKQKMQLSQIVSTSTKERHSEEPINRNIFGLSARCVAIGGNSGAIISSLMSMTPISVRRRLPLPPCPDTTTIMGWCFSSRSTACMYDFSDVLS